MDFLGKMKNSEQFADQVPHEFNFLNNNGHHFAPPNVVQSQGLQLLSNTVAFEADDHNLISRQIENQRAGVDRIFALHLDSLRHALLGTLHRVAEEKAAKVLKEKDIELEAKFARTIELEKMVNEYKKEEEWLKGEVNYLERTIKTWRLQLEKMNTERRYAAYAAKVVDDAESSFADTSLVEPVRLVCKVCDRRLAAVVVWPCRHACVCTGCVEAVEMCPVCGAKKTSTVELRLPID